MIRIFGKKTISQLIEDQRIKTVSELKTFLDSLELINYQIVMIYSRGIYLGVRIKFNSNRGDLINTIPKDGYYSMEMDMPRSGFSWTNFTPKEKTKSKKK
jgi:hypothetical protein